MKNHSLMLEMTAGIVSSHISRNQVAVADVPNLIDGVHASLKKISTQTDESSPEPAVNPKTALKKEHITCLECGKRFRTMKRHLNDLHDMSPEEYRKRWNLSKDYPMAAPGYSKDRRDLALKIGLGQKAEKS